jgi:hypothetical protein
MADSRPREAATLATIRLVLLGLVALGTIGMSVELALIGHWEDSDQLIPLVVAAAGLVAVTAAAVRPGVGTVRLLQFMMLTYIGTGIVGITLHYEANAEFQREIDPTLAGLALFWKVVAATAPPALAPGVMVQFGLLGLLYTYRHPALTEASFGEPGREMHP